MYFEYGYYGGGGMADPNRQAAGHGQTGKEDRQREIEKLQPLDHPMIKYVLGMYFNASQIDYYYED